MKKFLLLLSVLFVVSCSKDAVMYTLTTSTNPADGGILNPNGGTVNSGDQISVTQTPNSEFIFQNWSGAASGSSNTVTVIMDSDKTLTANYIKKKYALTTSVEGEGTVTEKVIKTGTATDYNSGTVVELTATAKAGWVFKEWSGDLTGTENPKEITIDKAKTVTAVFEALPPFYLDANGVTIKARDWVTVGTTGELNGVTYTAVDKTTIKEMVENDEDVTKVVTTLVTDMRSLFNNTATKNYDDFNEDISSWDVSNVTDMAAMFASYYGKFNQDISKWDVSNVTDMQYMFTGCNDFNQDISGWDVSNVTNMYVMFVEAYKFNANISSWDVSSVTNMKMMFTDADNFNQPIGDWDVSKVTDMNGMFGNQDCFEVNGKPIPDCSGFNQDISKWDVSSVTNMGGMFRGSFFFNQPIGDWDVSNVTNMAGVFQWTKLFNQDISKWDVSSVTDMSNMFWNAEIFNQSIGGWDVSSVTKMRIMFLNADNFNQPIGDWDVSKVTNMDKMFKTATNFNQNLSKWCVTNLSTEPEDFSTSSALTEANKPVWGTCPGNSYAISVSASSSSDYTLSGTDKNGNVSGNDPDLTFNVGDKVTFSVSAAGHPFYLKTVKGTGTGNQISGVTNNGTSSGSVVWKPSAAGVYYYQCSLHSGMVGQITVYDD